MCGVPFHAVDSYLTRLVDKGYKVAICEQLEDPKLAKGIVKRDVIRIVTPGTNIDIASLDEQSYRERLWAHTPITDFWRIGPGYARKLAAHGMFTMGDVAQLSLVREDLFYDLFGVNAELLIDHAWGIEPCTIREIKAYTPQANSLSTGQVLARPYQNAEGALIVREMAEVLAMDLVRKGLMTDQVVLTVCYDTENLADPARCAWRRCPSPPCKGTDSSRCPP